MDDDHLDPLIAERFRALDDVVVPDTWPGSSGPPVPARRWPLLAAAAAAVLIVGSIVVLSTRADDDEGSIVGAPVTSQPVLTTTAPTTTVPSIPSTVYVVENALAVAEPAIVVPGQQLTITPPAEVERLCTNIVDVFSPDDDLLIGQISGGRSWSAVVDGGPPPTWPACGGETTAEPLTVTVPPVADGSYRFCIANGASPDGCAVVVVVANGGEGIEPEASASPAVVVPGQLVTITPTEPVRRACTDLVAVYSGGTYVGHVGVSRFSPSPGEGDTVPACEGDVSGDPIDVFAPNLPVGRYVFCVSDDLLPEGCGQVDVLASTLLASVTSNEVANRDVITITPADVVPRICGDYVRVYDVTRTVPTVQVTDVMTGASEQAREGGWSMPYCAAGSSAEPLTMVVPDVATGAYAFCLSADLADDSCALVYVVEKRFDDPIVPPASTTPPAFTASPAASVVVDRGAFLGLKPDSVLADASEMIRENTAEITSAQRPDWACSGAGPRIWLTVLGGLTLVWEGDDPDSAVGPAWRYVGGSVLGWDVMSTDRGVSVGSLRQSVVDAYGRDAATGDMVFLPGYRLGFDGDRVSWIGNTGCDP